MLLAVGDIVWQAVIAGIVTIVLAWMSARTKTAVDVAAKKNEDGVAKAAEKVDGVKASLEISDQRTDKKLDTIHSLVNSSMTVQLKLVITALARVVELDSSPKNRMALETAENALHDHEKALEDYIARQAEAEKKAEANKKPVQVTIVQSEVTLPVKIEEKQP